MGSVDRVELAWKNRDQILSEEGVNFLMSKHLVDVKLTCEGRSIEAHRFVLSSASSYFFSLFKEGPCYPTLVFVDTNYSTLASLVSYIYTGKISIEEGSLQSFLQLCKKLKVKGVYQDDTSTPPPLTGTQPSTSTGTGTGTQTPISAGMNHSKTQEQPKQTPKSPKTVSNSQIVSSSQTPKTPNLQTAKTSTPETPNPKVSKIVISVPQQQRQTPKSPARPTKPPTPRKPVAYGPKSAKTCSQDSEESSSSEKIYRPPSRTSQNNLRETRSSSRASSMVSTDTVEALPKVLPLPKQANHVSNIEDGSSSSSSGTDILATLNKEYHRKQAELKRKQQEEMRRMMTKKQDGDIQGTTSKQPNATRESEVVGASGKVGASPSVAGPSNDARQRIPKARKSTGGRAQSFRPVRTSRKVDYNDDFQSYTSASDSSDESSKRPFRNPNPAKRGRPQKRVESARKSTAAPPRSNTTVTPARLPNTSEDGDQEVIAIDSDSDKDLNITGEGTDSDTESDHSNQSRYSRTPKRLRHESSN